jgi:UDP-glucose 4-epimerase
MTKQSILVTGATGFLGRHTCRVLARNGHRIFAVLRPGKEPPSELSTLVTEWVTWDMARPQDLTLPKGVQTLVHLAQSVHYREFPSGAQDMFGVNVAATFALLEAARRGGVSHFVYASSGGIYGSNGSHMSESERIIVDPKIGFYLTTKMIGELVTNNYAGFFSTALLRIFFAYGPGQQPDRLVPRLITNVMNGKPVTLRGRDGLAINPIYVDDAAEVVARLAEGAFEKPLILNVAGLEAVSLRRLCSMIGDIVGRAPIFEMVDESSDSLVGDTALMSRLLNFRPAVTLHDGLRATAQFLTTGQSVSACVPGDSLH